MASCPWPSQHSSWTPSPSPFRLCWPDAGQSLRVPPVRKALWPYSWVPWPRGSQIGPGATVSWYASAASAPHLNPSTGCWTVLTPICSLGLRKFHQSGSVGCREGTNFLFWSLAPAPWDRWSYFRWAREFASWENARNSSIKLLNDWPSKSR